MRMQRCGDAPTSRYYSSSSEVDTPIGADLQPAHALRERRADMRRCAQHADARGPQALRNPAILNRFEERENRGRLLKPLAPVVKEDLKLGNDISLTEAAS